MLNRREKSGRNMRVVRLRRRLEWVPLVCLSTVVDATFIALELRTDTVLKLGNSNRRTRYQKNCDYKQIAFCLIRNRKQQKLVCAETGEEHKRKWETSSLASIQLQQHTTRFLKFSRLFLPNIRPNTTILHPHVRHPSTLTSGT